MNAADNATETPSAPTTKRTHGKPFTSETGRQAGRRGGARSPVADIDIERGLRRKAKDDPRAAEVLLRWMARPRDDAASGDNMAGMSLDELERLHAGLIWLCSNPPEDLARIVDELLQRSE